MSILANPSGGAGGLQRCSTAVVTRGLIIHAGDTQGHCSRISSKLGHCSSLCKYFLHAVNINEENITKYFLVTVSLVLTTPQTSIQTNVTGHSQGSAVCSMQCRPSHHFRAPDTMCAAVLQCCSRGSVEGLSAGCILVGAGRGRCLLHRVHPLHRALQRCRGQIYTRPHCSTAALPFSRVLQCGAACGGAGRAGPGRRAELQFVCPGHGPLQLGPETAARSGRGTQHCSTAQSWLASPVINMQHQ